MQSHSKMMIVGLVVVAGVMAAGSAFAQSGAGSMVLVGPTRPQSADLGFYMPVTQDGVGSAMGFASASGGVVRVALSDVHAQFFGAAYRPLHHRHPLRRHPLRRHSKHYHPNRPRLYSGRIWVTV